MTFFIQKHIKTFLPSSLLISVAIFMLCFPLSTFAAYGSDAYGGCSYSQNCATVSTSKPTKQNKILGMSPGEVIEISAFLVAIVVGGGLWWITSSVRKKRRNDNDINKSNIITPN